MTNEKEQVIGPVEAMHILTSAMSNMLDGRDREAFIILRDSREEIYKEICPSRHAISYVPSVDIEYHAHSNERDKALWYQLTTRTK